MDLAEILMLDTIQAKVSALKEKSVCVPDWETLLEDYEPTKHAILEDKTSRVDKHRSDGTEEPASRISIGLEKLLTKRVNEFTFAIPVRRVYTNTEDNDTRQQIARALELIFKYARIDSENIRRGLAYYACCEILTIWYTVDKEHTLYGFPCKKKLKCQTFSPMDGTKLYPLFDEQGDLVAVSVEYFRKVEKTEMQFFETYTAEKHFKWANDTANGGWKELTVEGGEDIEIQKIPAIYNYRPTPVYHGLTGLRKEIEYALSRNSDVIAYNSAPVLKVAGGMQGEERKGEERRIVRVTNGGDVSYVSWQQSIDAMKYHVETLLKLFFMQAQVPDISFENMKGLGDIGYDARMTLLMDAHLKIGDESGNWLEFLDREVNVVKAFLKSINVKWASEIDSVDVENIITPFVQNDRKGLIDTLTAANGGKAVMSQLDSIRELGESKDPEATLKQIQEEDNASSASRMESLFNTGAM
ncbi:MAG: phage portal protein [Bacteroidaceae bacterium]|nr:phage portal protein [Bacteroidaceae bacterium]